jgi:hypothetical protein
VSYEDKRGADGESTRYPVVEFQATDGHLVTAHTDFGGDLVPKIGDHVDVLFDPARPEEAHIDSEVSDQINRLVGVIGWVIIVGAAIAAVALLVFLGGDVGI